MKKLILFHIAGILAKDLKICRSASVFVFHSTENGLPAMEDFRIFYYHAIKPFTSLLLFVFIIYCVFMAFILLMIKLMKKHFGEEE